MFTLASRIKELEYRATAHVTTVVEARADGIKKLVNSQFVKHVVWQIKDIAQLKRSFIN